MRTSQCEVARRNSGPLRPRRGREPWLVSSLSRLEARLPELRLRQVNDPRSFVRRWQLDRLLRAALLAMMAGCKSLAEMEELADSIRAGEAVYK